MRARKSQCSTVFDQILLVQLMLQNDRTVDCTVLTAGTQYSTVGVLRMLYRCIIGLLVRTLVCTYISNVPGRPVVQPVS
jgi:hypothetical protein